MSDSTVANLALHLAVYATKAGGPLPLLDGSSALLSLHGMGVLGTAAQRPSDGRWLRETPTWQTLEDGPTDHREYFLVVQWRRLLSKALLRHESTAGVSPELRRLAHHAWGALLPLIESHDTVLAPLLAKARANFKVDQSRLLFEPFWVGFESTDDELRFDAQVTALLASRWTDRDPHDGFCEAAARWFAEAFEPAIHKQTQRTIGRCTVVRHSKRIDCPTCPEMGREREFLSVLEVPALLDRRVRRVVTAPDIEQPVATPWVRRDNLRWILDTRSRRDGVLRFTHANGAPARLIHIQRLWERWVELKLPTMFDQLSPPDHINGPRQAQTLLVKLLNNAVIPASTYSTEMLFLEAGWGSSEDFATTYSKFIAVFDTSLLLALSRIDRQSAAMVRARVTTPKPGGSRPPRREAVLTWFPANGDPGVPIRVIRAQSVNRRIRNFYTTPYDVNDPMVFEKKLRVGRGLAYNGQLYWTAHTLNAFANEQTVNDEPAYPRAREFCDWVTVQEAQLDDKKGFRAAVYSTRLPDRLQAIDAGTVAHLGAYSQAEDELVRAFFVGQPRKRRLKPADWAPLLAQLPGRTETGILRRFGALGKKYAFEHGYQAYRHSPYCRQFAASRRKQWITEGCPE